MEAKSIALRLLAASSSHDKMITELCSFKLVVFFFTTIVYFCCCSALALLVEILAEPAQKDVINALTVLANVASRSETHCLVSFICDVVFYVGEYVLWDACVCVCARTCVRVCMFRPTFINILFPVLYKDEGRRLLFLKSLFPLQCIEMIFMQLHQATYCIIKALYHSNFYQKTNQQTTVHHHTALQYFTEVADSYIQIRGRKKKFCHNLIIENVYNYFEYKMHNKYLCNSK